ncbi:MAG: 3-hydroxyacyl-ACP dehydratase FabZ [Acidobacteria bacterium]|jgi:beta-hydroxyacyl-ACP dehydratase FabZ|nr:3-hydroxyacyl-ACP dehydratase FabZ [Acidobacteriota bacterium]
MKDISEILSVMPHRYPFLLVDRVLEMDDTKIRAVKNVTVNEPHFVGHFPEVPVMPGVLVVEAMAQAGGFLLFSQVDEREGKLIYFTGIDKCRFRKPVIPGDQLIFEVELVAKRSTFAKIKGRALVNDEVVCEAEMMSALAAR